MRKENDGHERRVFLAVAVSSPIRRETKRSPGPRRPYCEDLSGLAGEDALPFLSQLALRLPAGEANLTTNPACEGDREEPKRRPEGR